MTPACFPHQRQQLKHVRTNQSMDELLALTLKKRRYIESLGVNYVCTWEHDFQNLLAQSKEVATFIDSLDLEERLDPRDSFFGGRTNTVKLYYHSRQGEQNTLS